MINDFIINIEHIGLIVMLSVPFVLGIYLIYKTAQKKTTNLKERLVVSIQMGIAAILIYLTIIGALAAGLWFQTQSSNSVSLLMGMFICGSPLIFLITLAGSYIKAIYYESFDEYLKHHTKV